MPAISRVSPSIFYTKAYFNPFFGKVHENSILGKLIIMIHLKWNMCNQSLCLALRKKKKTMEVKPGRNRCTTPHNQPLNDEEMLNMHLLYIFVIEMFGWILGICVSFCNHNKLYKVSTLKKSCIIFYHLLRAFSLQILSSDICKLYSYIYICYFFHVIVYMIDITKAYQNKQMYHRTCTNVCLKNWINKRLVLTIYFRFCYKEL